MTLQLNYKECDHHLKLDTTSFKMSELNYTITLMKVFQKLHTMFKSIYMHINTFCEEEIWVFPHVCGLS
jgi:hypothetical protein